MSNDNYIFLNLFLGLAKDETRFFHCLSDLSLVWLGRCFFIIAPTGSRTYATVIETEKLMATSVERTAARPAEE